MKTSYKANDKVVSSSEDLEKMGKIETFSMTMERDPKQEPTRYSLDYEGIDGELMVSLINQMQESNATEATLSFERVARLLGYDLQITLRSPEYKKPGLWDRLKAAIKPI